MLILKKFARYVVTGYAVLIATSATAEENWFTFYGDPQDPAADYIQFDPSAISEEGGSRTIPVRVSRAKARTSQDGIVFRSFTGVAAIDCANNSARFLRASFFHKPAFQGTPFETLEYGKVIRPMLFREIEGERAQQAIRAACNKSITPR